MEKQRKTIRGMTFIVIKAILLVIFLFNLGLFDNIEEFIKTADIKKPLLYKEKYRYVDEENVGMALSVQYSEMEIIRSMHLSSEECEFRISLLPKTVIKQVAKKERELVRERWVKKIGDKLLIGNIFNQYLKNMPLVLILFLLWFKEDKRKINHLLFKGTGLLLFLFNLLIYPIIIAKRIILAGRYFLAEVHMRKTKSNVFIFLNDDEKRFLENFAYSKASFVDLISSLSAQGLFARRSIAVALLATLFLTLLPNKIGSGEEMNKQDFHSNQIMKIVENISYHSLDKGSDIKIIPINNFSIHFIHEINELILSFIRKIFLLIRHFIKQEVFLEIDHVPKYK